MIENPEPGVLTTKFSTLPANGSCSFSLANYLHFGSNFSSRSSIATMAPVQASLVTAHHSDVVFSGPLAVHMHP